MKNRYVLVKEGADIHVDIDYYGQPRKLFSTPDDSDNQGTSTIGLYQFAMDSDDKTFDVPFSYDRVVGHAWIDPVEGATGNIGSQAIIYQGAHRVETAVNAGHQGKTWEMHFLVPVRDGGLHFIEKLVSKDNIAISHVDANGNPLDGIRLEQARRNSAACTAYLRVVLNPNANPEDIVVTTNVNPDRAGFIRVTETKRMQDALIGIPADPR
jgi:hypothetical protein